MNQKWKNGDNRTKKSEPRSGPLRGCFTCGGDHYANQCPNKPPSTQPHGNPLPSQ